MAETTKLQKVGDILVIEFKMFDDSGENTKNPLMIS